MGAHRGAGLAGALVSGGKKRGAQGIKPHRTTEEFQKHYLQNFSPIGEKMCCCQRRKNPAMEGAMSWLAGKKSRAGFVEICQESLTDPYFASWDRSLPRFSCLPGSRPVCFSSGSNDNLARVIGVGQKKRTPCFHPSSRTASGFRFNTSVADFSHAHPSPISSRRSLRMPVPRG